MSSTDLKGMDKTKPSITEFNVNDGTYEIQTDDPATIIYLQGKGLI